MCQKDYAIFLTELCDGRDYQPTPKLATFHRDRHPDGHCLLSPCQRLLLDRHVALGDDDQRRRRRRKLFFPRRSCKCHHSCNVINLKVVIGIH